MNPHSPSSSDPGRGIRLCRFDQETAPFLIELQKRMLQQDLSLSALPSFELDTLARIQVAAQQRAYAEEFPHADDRVILYHGHPIGRLLVERRRDELVGIDILLLPGFRRRGIGELLIRALQAEAASDGRPFRFHVRKGNPALSLYRRLGFRPIDESETHFRMEWKPSSD